VPGGALCYSKSMSKINTSWLWIIAGLETMAIIGILLWGLVFRQTTPKVTQTPVIQTPTTQTTYKTPVIKLAAFAKGLEKPVAIATTGLTGDKRLFVVEQDGTIRVVDGDGKVADTAFLDVSSKIKSGGEMGLLGLAFHPKLNEKPYLYVNYVDKDQNTIVARYGVAGTNETMKVDAASEKVLLKIAQPYANHNGGNLAFGPDGYLYIGMGDGGSGGDPEARGQNPDELLGKMLRIDVDKGDPYAIPAGNTFENGGGKPEIWAMGLRNPWRFSFDSKTGDLYIADVGQGDWEEINFQPKSSKSDKNYGWRCFEGTHEFKTDDCQKADKYVQPILEYNHSENRCSVTGGFVYRGRAFPALAGKYFYGDYCGGQLYYAQKSPSNWTTVLSLQTNLFITTFGVDSAGELYVADYQTGTLHQVTDSANPKGN
jgi:glucose/arabinose dehydrogenase